MIAVLLLIAMLPQPHMGVWAEVDMIEINHCYDPTVDSCPLCYSQVIFWRYHQGRLHVVEYWMLPGSSLVPGMCGAPGRVKTDFQYLPFSERLWRVDRFRDGVRHVVVATTIVETVTERNKDPEILDRAEWPVREGLSRRHVD